MQKPKRKIIPVRFFPVDPRRVMGSTFLIWLQTLSFKQMFGKSLFAYDGPESGGGEPDA
jgi:hypothetical protein